MGTFDIRYISRSGFRSHATVEAEDRDTAMRDAEWLVDDLWELEAVTPVDEEA